MEVVIEYPNGMRFRAVITEDAMRSAAACALDDDHTIIINGGMNPDV